MTASLTLCWHVAIGATFLLLLASAAAMLTGHRSLSDQVDWFAWGAYAVAAALAWLLGWVPTAAVAAALAALWFWLMWCRRRRGRAPRSYGYKAKAAIAALVRKMREAMRPRPVLRPVPQAGA